MKTKQNKQRKQNKQNKTKQTKQNKRNKTKQNKTKQNKQKKTKQTKGNKTKNKPSNCVRVGVSRDDFDIVAISVVCAFLSCLNFIYFFLSLTVNDNLTV